MVYFIHHRQQYHLKDTYLSGIFWFLMRQVLQQQRKITFIVCINQILVLNTFSFLFVQTSSFINSISLSFDLSESWTLNFCSFYFGFYPVLEFLFFLLFQIQRMLVIVNKSRFSPRKIFKTFIKIPTKGYPVYKIESTSSKRSRLLECHLLPPLLFSHTKFQIEINISHVTFLPFVWIKRHLSSLTNVENLTRKLGHSDQICCREKGKEETNGNFKAFCVKCKRKKVLWSFYKAFIKHL